MTSAILGAVVGLAVFLQQGSAVSLLIPMAMSMALVYFFMVLPQRKQQRQLQAMRGSLKVGDSVVTSGGVCGTITLSAYSTIYTASPVMLWRQEFRARRRAVTASARNAAVALGAGIASLEMTGAIQKKKRKKRKR